MWLSRSKHLCVCGIITIKAVVVVVYGVLFLLKNNVQSQTQILFNVSQDLPFRFDYFEYVGVIVFYLLPYFHFIVVLFIIFVFCIVILL